MLQMFFVATVLAVVLAWVAIVPRACEVLGFAQAENERWTRKVSLGLAGWLVATAAIASSGWLRDFANFPPPLVLFLLATTTLTTLLAFSPLGTLLADGAGLPFLVGFQAFRLPLEIFLWWGVREGFVPPQMSWEGRNFDVLTGLTAAVVGGLALRHRVPRKLVLGWNLLGLVLLINVVGVAVLSMPTPIRRFFNEPAIVFVAGAPYIWLPLFLVQVAWFGHLLVFRNLARQPK
jgi:hypothetical protein